MTPLSGWLSDLPRDVRFAVRAFLRDPLTAALAVLTMALGIAATTTVFAVGNAMLLRPLPVADPDRLFVIDESRSGATSMPVGIDAIPYERFVRYREALEGTFSGLAADRYRSFSLGLGGGRGAEAVGGYMVSGNYFRVLGLVPAAGGFFAADDERSVVLSHGFWRDRLGGDPAIVGRTVQVDGRPYTVVGVAPRRFRGTLHGLAPDVWLPIRSYELGQGAGFADAWVIPFGRLARGVEPAAAAAAVDVAARRIPPDERHTTVRGAALDPLTGLPAAGAPYVRGFVAMLLGMALLVLLIAAANIAGMLLARAVARQREMGVRLALGASRARLVRLLMTETMLLFLLGGAGGVLLGLLGTRLLEAMRLPVGFDVAFDLAPDARVMVFAFLVTAATAVVFGLAPALRASRQDLATTLREGSAGSGRRLRGRAAFVVGQLALSVLLLVTAGLFARSLQQALATEPGLRPEGVTIAQVDLSPHGYDEARGRAFYAQLAERVEALPGVEGVALSDNVILVPSTGRSSTDVRRAEAEEREANVSFISVVPGYFEVMGIDLVAGRPFTSEDAAGAPPRVIVNETLAERLWPRRSPLGQSMNIAGADREVVGVTRAGKYFTLTEAPTGFAFLPFGQAYEARMTLHVRSRRPPAEIALGIREELRALDASVAMEGGLPLTTLMGLTLFPQRFAARLVGVFGLLGLLMAAAGLYALLSFQVAERRRELGIRLALGARPERLLGLVLGRGVLLAVAGVLVGAVLAAGAGRFVRGLMIGVTTLDPLTYLAVAVVLTAVAAVASWVPARRATRVDPMEVLRAE